MDPLRAAKILLILTLVALTLLIAFAAIEISYLLGVGFTLSNIVYDELPKDYTTTAGSSFNIVSVIIQWGLPIAIILGILLILNALNRARKV